MHTNTQNKNINQPLSETGKVPAIVQEFISRLESLYPASNKSMERHKSRGKLLARERIELLLDASTPFLELSAMAAYNQHNNQFPGAGIITGIGIIKGRETIIIANDATVKGGTYIKETIKKHLRAQEIAEQNNLACVYLVDSGGIFLPEQATVFPDKEDFGRIFFNQARLSAKGIPQISIVMGSCTAGGAYIPAMSDETIIVKNQGTIFLGGPPLVKAATGEEVSAEELGGGHLHTHESGVADHLANNDHHAIAICREIFETLTPPAKSKKRSRAVPSRYPSDHIYKYLPALNKTKGNIKKVIEHLTDDSQFQEFKQNYGTTLITGFAKINGYNIGILANDGILFSESAQKGTHFIQLCNQREIPMLFLQNITGFMVGKEYEKKGIAKEGAKMVNALANSKVPFFTIMTGGSYGAGNYAMGGRAFSPRFLFSWPGSSISVMGAKQAADVLSTIKKDQTKGTNGTDLESELKTLRKQIMDKYEEEGSAYYATSRLWDDGIIDPANTRKVLSLALTVAMNEESEKSTYGIYRM